MSVVVREAASADARAIAVLLHDAFLEFEALYTPSAFLATVPSESVILTRMGEGPVWVAEREQSVIGTVAAVRAGDCLLLRGMAVHSAARGLGVGRMLLEQAEHFARRNNLNRLSLHTTAFLEQAIRLYQAAGFQFTGETANPHGVELLCMAKILGEGNRRLVEQIFRDAKFVQSLGIELSGFGFGWCETRLNITPALLQQHEFVHAGAIMTLADHTCGGAAASTAPEDKDVITVENKVSFLRPASGQVLTCRSDVLRAGRNLIFTEAAVTMDRDNSPVIVAKASSTLAVIASRAMIRR